MSFEVLSNNQSSGERPEVDWKAYNEYVVKTCNLRDPEPIVGIVSGIISLGTQAPQPSVYLKKDDENEKAELERSPYAHYEDREKFFSDGKWHNNVRVKVAPNKPQQLVALTIDFPDIMLDRGQFFGGNDGEQPLRMLLGGEFTINSERVVASPLSLKPTKSDKTKGNWSLPFNSTLYKMARAAKVIDQDEPFLADKLDQLLGKAFQFTVQVCMNDAGYMVERCKFAAAIGRGQTVPAIDSDSLFLIQVSTKNSDSAIKQLKRSPIAIRNSIKHSEQWDKGCTLKDQLESTDTSKPVEKEVKAVPSKPKQESATASDDFLDGFDDIPF